MGLKQANGDREEGASDAEQLLERGRAAEGLPCYQPPPHIDTFQEKSGSLHFGRSLFLEGLIMSVVRLSLTQNTDPLFVFIGKIKYKTGSAPAGSCTKRL